MQTTDAQDILLLDDDQELTTLLQTYLQHHGFQVQCIHHPNLLENALSTKSYQALLLDLMLPQEDGLAIVRRLYHEKPALPILMMSARAEDADRIAGLEMGAQDFMTKPFNPRELLARLRVILRRTTTEKPPTLADRQCYTFGDFVLDYPHRTLHKQGIMIPLTNAEFSMLYIMVCHPHQVLTREQLFAKARHLDERLPFDRAIDARIARLRRKIEAKPCNPRFVKTVHGVGYRFDPDGV